MRKFDRFQDAAELSVEFDTFTDRRLYLKVGKYSVIIGFEPILNDKATVKYSRFTYDCSCGHSAMRAMPDQKQNHCKHCLAAISWLVQRKGRWNNDR